MKLSELLTKAENVGKVTYINQKVVKGNILFMRFIFLNYNNLQSEVTLYKGINKQSNNSTLEYTTISCNEYEHYRLTEEQASVILFTMTNLLQDLIHDEKLDLIFSDDKMTKIYIDKVSV